MSYRLVITLSLAVIVSLTLVGGALAGSAPSPAGGSSVPGSDDASEMVQEAAYTANQTADEGQDAADELLSQGGEQADDVLQTADYLLDYLSNRLPDGPECGDVPVNDLLPGNRLCARDSSGQHGQGSGTNDEDENTTVKQRLLGDVGALVSDVNGTKDQATSQGSNTTYDLLQSVWGPIQGAGQQAGKLIHGAIAQAEEALVFTINTAQGHADQSTKLALYLVQEAHDLTTGTIGDIIDMIEGIVSPTSSSAGDGPDEGAYAMRSASVETPEASSLVLGMIVASGVGLALAAMAALRRLLGLGGVTLLSRIPASQIMKNGSRQTIHDIVASDPGVSLNEIVDRVGLSRNAVAYHLAVFESEKVMSSVKDGKYRRYFINGGRYVNGAKNVVAAIKNEKTLDVIRYISEHPGVIQKDVCSAVGTSPSATSWHIRRLEKVGLVEKEREANMVRYNPGPNLERYDLSAFGLQTTPGQQGPAMVAQH